MKFSAIKSVGQAYQSEGNYAKAREEYKRAIKMERILPLSKFATQMQIAFSYLLEKNYDSARTEFKKLLDYRSLVPAAETHAFLFIGKSYGEEGNPHEARMNYVKAIESTRTLSPDLQLQTLLDRQCAQMGVADSYFAEKNYIQAKIEYVKTLAMEKLNANVRTRAKKQLKTIVDMATPAKSRGTTTK